jgi:hypothetical protein
MENETFWKLHSNIALHLIHNNQQHDIMYRDWAPNGRILASTRISCALRYFAGGCPYDIAIMHGVSHTAIFDSVWMVVDGIKQYVSALSLILTIHMDGDILLQISP